MQSTSTEPSYHYRGADSSDDKAQAEGRKREVGIRQAHRAARE